MKMISTVCYKFLMETKQDGKKKILAKSCVASTLKHEMLILMQSVTLYLNRFAFSPFSFFF